MRKIVHALSAFVFIKVDVAFVNSIKSSLPASISDIFYF